MISDLNQYIFNAVEEESIFIPNWSAAPEWAQYWAIDSDGRAFWYGSRPDEDGIMNTFMVSSQEKISLAKVDYDLKHIDIKSEWKNTLTSRPDSCAIFYNKNKESASKTVI